MSTHETSALPGWAASVIGERRAAFQQHAALVLLAIALLAGNVGYVSLRRGFMAGPERVKELDHHFYIAMAGERPEGGERDPHSAVAPFCWRVLVPWIVRGLAPSGLTLDARFFLVTNLALLGFLLTLAAWLRRLGFTRQETALGLLLAGLTPGVVRWYEYQYWMTDPLGLFLVTLALLLVERGARLALAFTGVLGLATRESFLLVFPYYFARRWRERGFWRSLLETPAVALAPIAVFVLVRSLVEPLEGGDMLAAARSVLAFRWRHISDNQPYFMTLGSFGALLPLALLSPRSLLEMARRRIEACVFIVLTYATLAVGNNTDRLLCYALPLWLAAALRQARLLEPSGRSSWAWAALIVGVQTLFYAETRFGARGMSLYQPTSWPVVVACALLWIVARWRLRRLAACRAPVPRAC
jgi:hypothetical protein